MPGPNPQLEAALARFTDQPGVTADHAAQLRVGITADARLLEQFNVLAAAGQIRGFALQRHQDPQSQIGIYDKSGGIVSLSAAGFEPGDDLQAMIRLQQMSVAFAHRTWADATGVQRAVSQDMLDNLQATINGSPALAEQMKEAARLGHVRQFALLDNAMAAGATYDGRDGVKAINLPVRGLQTGSETNPQGRFEAFDLTLVLGHEARHGFNHADKTAATTRFLEDIRVQARVLGAVHDYTDEIATYLQAGREDEARAHIAGWNALLSRERQHSPHADGLELIRATRNDRIWDFINEDHSTSPPTLSPRPGLTFNADGSLDMTPANIAAMGRHYFDRPAPDHAGPGDRPMTLGHHRGLDGTPRPSADYTNYYGKWALEQIVRAEAAANVRYQGARPELVIDMSALGLKEDLIEKEGLDLHGHAAWPYHDSSTTPMAPGRFDHTRDGSFNPLHDHQHVPVPPTTIGAPWRNPDPHLDAWIDALRVDDREAASAALRAFGQSPRGQELQARNHALHREHLGRQPGRDDPLFARALERITQLGPEAAGDRTDGQLENVAAALALQARHKGLPDIETVTADKVGRHLTASWINPGNPVHQVAASVDRLEVLWQAAQQSLQSLSAEPPLQDQQAREQQAPGAHAQQAAPAMAREDLWNTDGAAWITTTRRLCLNRPH